MENKHDAVFAVSFQECSEEGFDILISGLNLEVETGLHKNCCQCTADICTDLCTWNKELKLFSFMCLFCVCQSVSMCQSVHPSSLPGL